MPKTHKERRMSAPIDALAKAAPVAAKPAGPPPPPSPAYVAAKLALAKAAGKSAKTTPAKPSADKKG